MLKGKEKNSNIELLKVIAIGLIIFSHSIPYGYWTSNRGEEYIDIGLADTAIGMQLIRYLGQIGNIIFIICSSWFIINKQSNNHKKILYIIDDSVTISIMCLIIVKLLSYSLNMKTIIKQFFPITYSSNWFVGCYIVFYIITPGLNMIISKLNKEQLLRMNILLICFNFWQMIIENNYIYNYLIGFIIIYFIVAYIKKYMIEYSENLKINVVFLGVCIVLLVSAVIIYNKIANATGFMSDKMQYFTNIKNPLVFGIAISIFNIFNKLKIKNNWINYIASQTLIIYLFHDNYLIRTFIKEEVFSRFYAYGWYTHINIVCLGLSVVVFIISLIISSVYMETIQKVTYKVCDRIYNLIKKHYLSIENKLLKLTK